MPSWRQSRLAPSCEGLAHSTACHYCDVGICKVLLLQPVGLYHACKLLSFVALKGTIRNHGRSEILNSAAMCSEHRSCGYVNFPNLVCMESLVV